MNQTERSQQLETILNSKPAWIIRWGTLLLFVFIITLIVFTSYVKYRDAKRVRILEIAISQDNKACILRTEVPVSLPINDSMELQFDVGTQAEHKTVNCTLLGTKLNRLNSNYIAVQLHDQIIAANIRLTTNSAIEYSFETSLLDRLLLKIRQ